MRKKNLVHGWTALCLSGCVLLSACGKDQAEPMPNFTPVRQFTLGGSTYSPVDLKRMELKLTFDVSTREATGEGFFEWRATADGYGFFLSDPALTDTNLDERSEISLRDVKDPDQENILRVVDKPLRKGERHRLHFRYRMPASEVTFREGGVGFVTSMGDLMRGNFLEAYAPTGFEDDPYALTLQVEVKNGANEHQLYANGEIETEGRNAWKVEFPDYFSTSSFYFHVTDANYPTRKFVYQAVNGPIPITVYSASAAKVDEAVSILPGLFDELESTYGPYAHNSFTAYISGSGGMEHVGATITGISSLDHELLHSWFARGVMPAEGRSGWIDEAIASWRDYGYKRAQTLLARKPTNLGRFSPFRRFTPKNCYVDGRALMSEFDLVLADRGGLKPALKEWFRRYRKKTVRTADFQRFMEERAGQDLTAYFDRYVYGGDPNFRGQQEEELESDEFPVNQTRHPPPLTREEIEKLR